MVMRSGRASGILPPAYLLNNRLQSTLTRYYNGDKRHGIVRLIGCVWSYMQNITLLAVCFVFLRVSQPLIRVYNVRDAFQVVNLLGISAFLGD